MGTRERRERERVDTRGRILAAARDMFAREGYDAVTMRAIADSIEYTPTALYHHFPSKQALLTELCERDFGELARHFVGKAVAADPLQRLRSVGEAYLQFAEQYPSQYRFMFMTVMPDEPETRARLAEDRDNPERNAYAFLRSACADAIGQKLFRPEYDDPDAIAQMLWGAIHGLISLRITKRDQDVVPWRDLKKTARQAMDVMMAGLQREPRR
jgi:AcrR family transcriptional regulator